MPLPPLSDTTLRDALARRNVEFVRDLRVFASLPSTNDEARRLAAEGAPEGTLVAADEQTAGRGRAGRTWLSPAGKGVYASLLLRPREEAARSGEMSLLAGAAFAEALTESAALAVRAKWPNDLVVAGKKIGGILVEGAVMGGRMEYMVVGVGVNVAFELEELRGARQPATSVLLERRLGGLPPREEILAAMMDSFSRHLASYRALGWEYAATLWRRASAHRAGDPLTVIAEDETRRGAYAGVAPGGGLLLRLPDGATKAFAVGETRLRTEEV